MCRPAATSDASPVGSSTRALVFGGTSTSISSCRPGAAGSRRQPASARPYGVSGLPPIAYLSRLRAEVAASLLLRTAQPITQISRSVGWPDQNYFARRFKAHFGLTATTYRKRFAEEGQPLLVPREPVIPDTGVATTQHRR